MIVLFKFNVNVAKLTSVIRHTSIIKKKCSKYILKPSKLFPTKKLDKEQQKLYTAEVELQHLNFPVLFLYLHPSLLADLCQFKNYCNLCAYYICVYLCNVHVYCSDPLKLSFYIIIRTTISRISVLKYSFKKEDALSLI